MTRTRHHVNPAAYGDSPDVLVVFQEQGGGMRNVHVENQPTLARMYAQNAKNAEKVAAVHAETLAKIGEAYEAALVEADRARDAARAAAHETYAASCRALRGQQARELAHVAKARAEIDDQAFALTEQQLAQHEAIDAEDTAATE